MPPDNGIKPTTVLVCIDPGQQRHANYSSDVDPFIQAFSVLKMTCYTNVYSFKCFFFFPFKIKLCPGIISSNTYIFFKSSKLTLKAKFTFCFIPASLCTNIALIKLFFRKEKAFYFCLDQPPICCIKKTSPSLPAWPLGWENC